MNSKALIPLGASLFMGLIAMLLVRHMIANKGPAPERSALVKVVAAKAELPPGHALTADDLVLAPIAASAPPPNTSTDPAHLVGRVILAPMFAGQPVLESQLAPQGTAAGLQALVPDGMRAISVDTTESSGLLGLLMPGSRVDVVSTSTSTNSNEPALSRIIAQDVTVLAVGQRLAGTSAADGQNTASRMVTLLVTPHDAAALDLAQTMARVRLILRGTSDRGEIDDDPVLLTDLRGGAVAAQPAIVPSSAPAGTQQAATATQPTVSMAQPATPTTQPVPQETPHRIVTLILGNQEQRLSFHEEPKPGPSEISDTVPNDPFANP